MATGPFSLLHLQCAAEFHTLAKFFVVLSRNGVRVPEDSYRLREELDDWKARFHQSDPRVLSDRVWPSSGLVSLMALAQHHGIPTRALDWTWSAQVAAYFAARPALGRNGDDHIAVWAINDLIRQADQDLVYSGNRPLRVFTVSGAENENLRAQRGLFMLHPQCLPTSPVPFLPTTYDQLLQQSLPALKYAVLFIRVMVHESEACRLLGYLARAGVTTGTLHPGLSGSAREYEEEHLIQPLPFKFRTIENEGLWDLIDAAARARGA